MQKIVPGIYAVAMCLLGYALGPGAGSVVVETSESGGQAPELQSPLVTETVSAGFTLAEMAEDVASDYPAIIQELWMGDDPAKEDRLLLVIAQWCEIAPEAAIEYLKELGRAWQENVDARGVSLGQWIYETGGPFADRVWARVDREAAEQSIAIRKEELLRLDAMRNPDAIEAYLASGHHGDSARELMRTFAHERTEDAMRLVVEQGAFGGDLLREVADVLVERDPQAALAWAKDAYSGHDERNATAAVIKAWARIDPEAAVTYAATTDHFHSALREFASQDYRQAFRWLQKNPPEFGTPSMTAASTVATGISDAPLEEIVSVFSEIFPDAAVEGSTTPFSLDLSASFSGQLGAVTLSMRSNGWPGENAAAVAAELADQPRSGLRDALLGLALNRWAETDPGGAIETMRNVAATTGIEAAGTWVSPDAFDTNPDAAFEFAALLPASEKVEWLRKFVEKM